MFRTAFLNGLKRFLMTKALLMTFNVLLIKVILEKALISGSSASFESNFNLIMN